MRLLAVNRGWSVFEKKRHVDGVGLIVDLRLGPGFAQVIKEAFIAHVVEKIIRIFGVVRRGGLVRPHLADSGFAMTWAFSRVPPASR